MSKKMYSNLINVSFSIDCGFKALLEAVIKEVQSGNREEKLIKDCQFEFARQYRSILHD